jgi:hypothetical protein
MKASTKAIRFLETLAIPEGPKAGELIKLAPFQKQFVEGVSVAVLSINRENAKTPLSISNLLGSLLGEVDEQPQAKTLVLDSDRNQAQTAFDLEGWQQ